MAYPVFYPFKTRMYQASTTSSATTTLSAVVAARGKYLGGYVSGNGTNGTTVASVVDILLNGTGVTGSTGVATTSTGNFASYIIPPPTTSIYLKPGDVLTCSTTDVSTGGISITHVVQEF